MEAGFKHRHGKVTDARHRAPADALLVRRLRSSLSRGQCCSSEPAWGDGQTGKDSAMNPWALVGGPDHSNVRIGDHPTETQEQTIPGSVSALACYRHARIATWGWRLHKVPVKQHAKASEA